MKKTLVAAAALASVSAFAQTTVTLSGNIDFAGASLSGTQVGQKGTTFSTTFGTSSTSVINLIATEDLGGGLKVTGKYGLDPRSLSNDGFAVTNTNYTSGTPIANTNTATGLARDEVFISLEGSFGTIKLGAPNTTGLDTNTASSPLGTGVGSGYGTAGKAMQQMAVTTRYDRAIKYESPVMNGFTGTYQYAPGNDEVAVVDGSTAYNYVARSMPNNRQVTEVGFKYSNGPLNAAYVNINTAAQTNRTGWYSVANSSATIVTTLNYVATKMNVLGLNYNLGSTTLYYGYNNGDSNGSTTTLTKLVGQRVGLKRNMGNIDLIAQYTAQKAGTTQAKVTGIRADFNLSKTAKTYLGYENWDTGSVATDYSTLVGQRKIISAGIQKSF